LQDKSLDQGVNHTTSRSGVVAPSPSVRSHSASSS
jgi:hypothetical protein